MARKADHAERFMDRYGRWAVLIGRVTPVVRTVISLPAGMSRMEPLEFTLLTVLGSIPWNTALVYEGMILGENWETIAEYLGAVAIVVVAALGLYLLRRSPVGRADLTYRNLTAQHPPLRGLDLEGLPRYVPIASKQHRSVGHPSRVYPPPQTLQDPSIYGTPLKYPYGDHQE